MGIARTTPARGVQILADATTTSIPECRLVYVGGGGTLVVDMKSGQLNQTISNVASGAQLPIEITKIYNTSTATDVTVFY